MEAEHLIRKKKMNHIRKMNRHDIYATPYLTKTKHEIPRYFIQEQQLLRGVIIIIKIQVHCHIGVMT